MGKIKPIFWTGQIAGLLMLFFFASCNQVMEGTATEPGGILTGDGVLAVILMSVLALVFGTLFLWFLIVTVGRRNKREGEISNGIAESRRTWREPDGGKSGEK